MEQKLLVLSAQRYNKLLYPFFNTHITPLLGEVSLTPQDAYQIWYQKTLEETGLIMFQNSTKTVLYEVPELWYLFNHEILDPVVSTVFCDYRKVLDDHLRSSEECTGLLVTQLHLFLQFPLRSTNRACSVTAQTTHRDVHGHSELSRQYTQLSEDHIRRLQPHYHDHGRRSGLQSIEVDGKTQRGGGYLTGQHTFLGHTHFSRTPGVEEGLHATLSHRD